MKYFVDPNSDDNTLWDIKGYEQNVEDLKEVLGTSYTFFKKGLHDYSLKIEIYESSRKNVKEVVAKLVFYDPYEKSFQTLLCENTKVINMNYDASKYLFADSQKLVEDEGYGEILIGEVRFENKLLKLELELVSKTKIYIAAERLVMQK